MKHAFSLVELSIVLVILGLLVGGVLTGQSLIRAAELRSVTTEFQQFNTAVQTFRDRFFAIPGDMRNAEDFWGTMGSGTCPNATGGTGTQTCNGNGDGEIRPSGAASQTNELFTFWQHLANAGLIEGSFTGISDAGGTQDGEAGLNIPGSRFGNAGWAARTGLAGTANQYAVDYGNAYIFGTIFSTGTAINRALTPEEAWNIDTKSDDGRPGAGSIIAVYWNNSCANATANNDFDSDYRLEDDSVQCAMVYRNAF